MASSHDADWQDLAGSLESLRSALGKSTAKNVSGQTTRADIRAAVQVYFRRVRPHLEELGCSADAMSGLDAEMQTLLRLANGVNRRTTYVQTFGKVRKSLGALEVEREMQLGARHAIADLPNAPDRMESLILDTLKRLVPSAALSYEQSILDLQNQGRVSFRGTANELRETVREVLDHLAPDDQVMAAQGFKLEKDRVKPTQKQKVRFLLKSRGLGESSRRAPEDATSLIEELTASLTRSAYDRGSISAHIATAGQEVRQLKMYVDSVLAELLEVHSVSSPASGSS